VRIHALFHSRLEPLGAIQEWIRKHQFTLTSSHSWQGEPIPHTNDYDMLIVLGGPQTPKQLHQYPFLQKEIDMISQAAREDKIILGICLGAQLIAEAFGAKTVESPHKEFGTFPIELTEAGLQDPIFKDLPKSFDVMHWHSDMPSLPEDAVLLATSAGCPHQVIRFADRVYGFQTHMEFTYAIMQVLLRACHNDLIPGEFTQTPDEMIEANFEEINQKVFHCLDRLIAL